MRGVLTLLSLTLFTLVQSGPISFTLGNNQMKCFKDDLAEGTILDLFVEVFANIAPLITPGSKSGIKITIFDPNGIQIEKYTLQQETHKGYQKILKTQGLHRICVRASKALFIRDPNMKYEVSLQIEANYAPTTKEVEELKNNPGLNPFSNYVTKDHIDKVDIEIDTLQKKALTILQDQRRQFERQTEHQKEYEKFSSNFVLFVSIQILIIIGTVVWQILSLRKFFVQKNIF
ncbi:transmembrane emp24 domain-containing protein 11-like [Stylonychia lemnae]|uniref:Transmembrane emp24 domain-containing protein 11-like n=1 Tax=Stylonychia lemnae TaxID=5949 RepID=A0A078AXL8_STYLE|nr:transmembrane emp24 domain-containing protein 11-like [Stylonychia lemnae]|eukprot:CDW87210.1 transmembrane emp24 domain-containing protein 11-like [Stylonychia lemnae]